MEKATSKDSFFRDYEDLPISSPFDIDILIDLEDRDKFLKIIEKLSRQNDLLYFIKKTKSYCLILIFDLTREKKKRNWIFYETRSVFQVCKRKKLCVHDIVKDYSKGFPVPNQEWSFFFYFFSDD